MVDLPSGFRLTLESQPSADEAVVSAGLLAYNIAQAGEDGYMPLNVFVRDESGTIQGGLLGNSYWRWLAINKLWIDDSLRGKGIGSQMVRTAEEEAIRRGCIGVHVDTMSFQAPAFYEKLGYEVFGVIPDIPPGHSRVYLRKWLTQKT